MYVYMYQLRMYIMYICRNTLLEGIYNFIHLNLAIALILALIVFVSGIETATNNEVSKRIAMYSLVQLVTYYNRLVVQ